MFQHRLEIERLKSFHKILSNIGRNMLEISRRTLAKGSKWQTSDVVNEQEIFLSQIYMCNCLLLTCQKYISHFKSHVTFFLSTCLTLLRKRKKGLEKTQNICFCLNRLSETSSKLAKFYTPVWAQNSTLSRFSRLAKVLAKVAAFSSSVMTRNLL